MGSTLTCKFCNKEVSKTQIINHQLQCERIIREKNEKKQCEICKIAFKKMDYYDHVLSHYKIDSPKEECNPSIAFCDYNFSSKKIKRVTRISDNMAISTLNDRKDYSNIQLSDYLRNRIIVCIKLVSNTLIENKNEICPVEAELLVLLPKMTLENINDTDDKTCAICMKDYERYDKLLTTPCNHNYHFDCIRGWFRKNNTCPICKFKVIKTNLTLKPAVKAVIHKI